MKLYCKHLSMHLRSQMQHKLSFVISMVSQFLVSFTSFLGISFMFSRFKKVEGFTYPQVLLCFAVVLVAFSLAECFGRGFDLFPQMIRSGEFDRVLVRPRSPALLVLASKADLTRIGRLVQALFVFAYALPASGVVWKWDKILTLFLMVACGALIFFGLFVVYAAFAFFTVDGLEFMNVLTDGGREFGRYPFSVYGGKVLGFLTFVVPLALFQYYPLLYLLGREQSLLFMLAPLLGLLFLPVSYVFWKIGLRRYTSTGS